MLKAATIATLYVIDYGYTLVAKIYIQCRNKFFFVGFTLTTLGDCLSYTLKFKVDCG